MKRMKSKGNAAGIAVGVAINLVLLTIITIIVTSLLYHEQLANGKIPNIGYVVHFAVSVIGLLVAGKTAKGNILISIGICAAVYIVIVLSINLIVLNAGLQNCWKLLLSVLSGGSISCAICIRNGKPKHLRKKRI